MKKSILTFALAILLLMATALTVSASSAEGTTTEPITGWNTPENRALVTMSVEDAIDARTVMRDNGWQIDHHNGPLNDEIALIFELEVLRLTNIERANYGLHPLVWCDYAARSARNHSINMAITRTMSHDIRGLAVQAGRLDEYYRYNHRRLMKNLDVKSQIEVARFI